MKAMRLFVRFVLLALSLGSARGFGFDQKVLYLFIRNSVMTTNNIEPYLQNAHVDRSKVRFFTVDYNPVTANHVRDYQKLVAYFRDVSKAAEDGVILVGYSATAKFAARLARDESNVRALFLMDPVDGSPPMVRSKNFPEFLTDGHPLIQVPTRIVKSEFGSLKRMLNAACVPEGEGADHFARHINPDMLDLTQVDGAGHTDFMKPPMAFVARVICHPGKSSADAVIQVAAEAWDSFLERVLP